jgi:carboxyl-terminal processing protease
MRTIAILTLLCGAAQAAPDKPRDRFPEGERAFREARDLLAREYIDASSEEDLWRAASQGLTEKLADRPWDQLLSPTEMAAMRADLHGELVGVGVEIHFDQESGITTVLATLPGSPAEHAGIASGDQILKVDGRTFKGADQHEVVRAMRGRPGDPVRLTVLHGAEVSDKTVRREALVFAPVSDATLPGGAALVSIRSFNEKTAGLLAQTLKRLAAGRVRALVIDLRGDEGGLFDGMLGCANLLVPRGKVIVTKIGRGGHEEAIRSSGEPILPVPTVVLVDGRTASGAEILAGALGESAGARVVGEKTRGKWNVQKLAELSNGWALKFTTGTFKSPAGVLRDGRGLEPQVEVAMDAGQTARAQRIADVTARIAADPGLRAALALLGR